VTRRRKAGAVAGIGRALGVAAGVTGHVNRHVVPDDGVRLVSGSVRLRPGPDIVSHDDYVGNTYTALAASLHIYAGHHVRLLNATYVTDGIPVTIRPVLQWVPPTKDAVGFSRGDISRDYPDSRFIYRLSDAGLSPGGTGGWFLLSQLVPQVAGIAHLEEITVELSIDGRHRRRVTLPQDLTLEVRHAGHDPQGTAHGTAGKDDH
jgi:hypothetical protein